MPISSKELEKIIRQTFNDATIKITDLVGDEDHYLLEITDPIFKGKTLIAQHRMVKDALSEVLNSKLHSVTIKTSPHTR
jgi:stress-induced morphogen